MESGNSGVIEDILYVLTGTFVYGRPYGNDYVCLGEQERHGEKSICREKEKKKNKERKARFSEQIRALITSLTFSFQL